MVFSAVAQVVSLLWQLCINVCVIILDITCGFYSCCACGFVAMGKVNIGLYFSLTLGILTKALY